MDWFTIVLIFLFIVLPVIQQVLEAARKSGEEVEESLPEELEAGDLPSLPRPSKSTDNATWSDGWTEWPGAETKPEGKALEKVTASVPAVDDMRRAVVDRFNQRVAAVTRREADRHPAGPEPAMSRTKRRRGGRPRDLQRALRDADSARRALILSEVLGPPAALRPTHLDAPEG